MLPEQHTGERAHLQTRHLSAASSQSFIRVRPEATFFMTAAAPSTLKLE